jgi:hypothetical protein
LAFVTTSYLNTKETIMRKSTLFISAVLTTFMLAVLVGVVSAYKNTLNVAGTTTQQDPTAIVADLPTPTAEAFLTPEQAAALAAQVIGRTDLYSVETTIFNDASAYLVTFSSGDLVYVSPEGMILSITKLPPVASDPGAPATSNNNHPRRGGGGAGGGGGGSDDDGDDGGGGDD